jgi:hypothetical protein
MLEALWGKSLFVGQSCFFGVLTFGANMKVASYHNRIAFFLLF